MSIVQELQPPVLRTNLNLGVKLSEQLQIILNYQLNYITFKIFILI